MRRLVLLAALLLFVLPARAGDEPWLFATDGAYPPFAATGTDGEARGMEAELVAMLCAEAVRTCEIAVVGWPDLVAGLKDGRWDAAFSGISSATAASLGLVATAPHTALAARFVTLEGGAAPGSVDELDGFVVGALWGTPHAAWLEARAPAQQLRRFPDEEELVLSLHSGVVDLVFADALMLQRGMLASPMGEGVVFVGPPVDLSDGADTGLVLMLAPGSPLKAELDAALAALARDGRLAALRARHLPGYPEF